MKKIIAFSHTYPTEYLPSQGLIIKSELDLLSNNGFYVSLYIPQALSPFKEQQKRSYKLVESNYPKKVILYLSIPKRKFPKISLYNLKKSISKLTLLKENQGVIHLHWLYPNGILAPYFKKLGFKVIITIHGTDWYDIWNKPSLKSIVYNALEAADKIITVGTTLGKAITNPYPEFESKVIPVLHGIDTNFFVPLEAKLLKSVPEIICVANLFEVKGVDVLLHALSKLNNKEFHLNIISSSIDQKHKLFCYNLVQKHRLSSNVTFKESLNKFQLLAYYQQADFCVLPSRSEGFGLALAEAGACGLPSISTFSGGPEEIITPETGILVNPESVSELAQALEIMLKTFKNYSPNEIRSHIETYFSLKIKLQNLSNIYASL